jgi:hypothetical protein
MKTHVIAPSCKQLFYSVLILGAASLTSCKKESTGDEAITSEEAAEVMSQSVTDENEGAAAYFEGNASASASASDSSGYIINETITRSGKIVSKLRRRLTFTKEATLKAVRVIVNKTTHRIVSGTIEIVIKGTNSAGGTFYYTGNFTFHGNGNGTLVLQNGQSFDLHW